MPIEGVHRPAWAEISASAFAHNVRSLKAVVDQSSLCAVVKANGYGHGGALVARAALEGGADSFAVAIVDEGIELRRAGITTPILLLAEIHGDTIADALGHSLTLTVGSLEGAKAAIGAAEKLGGVHRVHVKVDTGMHRMGVAPEEADEVVDLLDASSAIDLEGLYTHFSVADGSSASDRTFTRAQIARFDELVAALNGRGSCPRVVHAANSAGALGYPQSRRSMVRVGLSLYGYLPAGWLAEVLDERGVGLEPAMSLRSQVVAVRRVAAGERPTTGAAARSSARRPSRPCPSATPTAIRAACARAGPRC